MEYDNFNICYIGASVSLHASVLCVLLQGMLIMYRGKELYQVQSGAARATQPQTTTTWARTGAWTAAAARTTSAPRRCAPSPAATTSPTTHSTVNLTVLVTTCSSIASRPPTPPPHTSWDTSTSTSFKYPASRTSTTLDDFVMLGWDFNSIQWRIAELYSSAPSSSHDSVSCMHRFF